MRKKKPENLIKTDIAWEIENAFSLQLGSTFKQCMFHKIRAPVKGFKLKKTHIKNSRVDIHSIQAARTLASSKTEGTIGF